MRPIKCISKSRTMRPCCYYPIDKSLLCHIHQYQSHYTAEMMDNLSICSGCKKSYYLTDDRKICEGCKDRGKETREKMKESTVVVPCAKSECKNKKSAENDFCKLHQIEVWLLETRNLGLRPCKNYVRGCREQLPTDQSYRFSNCSQCLEKERNKDAVKRGAAKTAASIVDENIHAMCSGETANETIHTKQCTTCCRECEINDFIGQKRMTKTCKQCRDSNKKQDGKRDKEHRAEQGRKYDAKPERKETKRIWVDENPEKVAKNWINYRAKQIENGVEKYLEKNAENQRKWRENNPEKAHKINEKNRESPHTKYKIYQMSANKRNLAFEITVEQYTSIVETPCYYCGEEGQMGIDRKNNSIGYLYDNCVSSCKMCNYMKNSLTIETFLGRIKHILCFQNRISQLLDKRESLKPQYFADHFGGTYTSYSKRAKQKGLDFHILHEEFTDLVSKDCYICGKSTSTTHNNGIDRFDNTIGYISENVRPCCGECNYMKRDFTWNNFIEKCEKIYGKHMNQNVCDQIQNSTESSIMKGNKKTREELQRDYQERKEDKKKKLMEKYGNPENKAQILAKIMANI